MVITGFLILNVKTITTGTLVYYIYVTNLIIEKSQAIEDNLYKFMKNMAAFDNIDQIFQTEIRANDKGEDISDISEIKFDSVSLSYGNELNIFENKSFTLKKGDAVLIKGKNGSGKSSILKMITGLIAPSGGDIRYNGISFQDINMQALSKNICYLNQEELLLNETMRDYLSIISHKEISQKEYEEYSARVNLQKEDTVITDNGKNFSGGEKKKAIIMKLLARKNEVSVILLDEIEAGLDKKSQEITEAIEKDLLDNKEKYIIVKISHGNISNRNMYNKVIELS
jgi:ABC-type bacteriocin/lantibiotic exporter with double-glycine peptidase domain